MKIPESEWTLTYYEEYSSIFLDGNGVVEKNISRELIALSNCYGRSSLRACKTYKCLQFLIHLDKEKKLILVATPQASQELALVKWYDQFTELRTILGKDEIERLNDLRKHINLIASSDIQESASYIEQFIEENGLPDMMSDSSFMEVEKEARVLTKTLIDKISSYKSSLFEKFTDFGLDLTANFMLFRVHLLKFLAILPSLDYDIKGKEVKRVLLEALRRLLEDSSKAKILGKKGPEAPIPTWCFSAVFIAYWGARICPTSLLANIVRFLVRFMADRFIAGESIDRSETTLKELLQTRRGFTVDQLGELVVSEKEADIYCDAVLALIRGMSKHVTPGTTNSAGVYQANVSVKVSALCSDFRPQAFDYTYGMVGPRLQKILVESHKAKVFLNVDAEHIHYRDLVFDIYKKVLLTTPELSDYQQTGIVLQGYLRDSYQHLQDILALAKERKLLMPVRLVKGAYWDAETIEGDAHNFPAPQFLNKEETDINFRYLIFSMLEHGEQIQLIIASHNIQDHCWCEVLREKKFPKAPIIEHQCLHMTYEALSIGLSKMNWPVRNYVPVGSLLMGMGYLVRRIMENSSQVGFLTMMRSHKMADTFLPPFEKHRQNRSNQTLVFDPQISKLSSRFINVYPARLYLKDQRDQFFSELKKFEKEGLGQKYSHPYEGEKNVEIFSSSNPDILVGSINYVDLDQAKKIVDIAKDEFENGTWSSTHSFQRAAILLKAANLLLIRRNELASLIIYEAGKSIEEALADVDEAIDFLTFYAREEANLKSDRNSVNPRGVMAVISPWNFPLAIPCGMVSSALVAGNTVILKPAKHTPLIAQKLIDILHEAGVPQNALIHLPGSGATVGKVLVENKDINGVIFTGSKEVGTWIYDQVASRYQVSTLANQKYVVPNRVVTEMGGKNAIVVTADAELDETVAGVLYSAFAHAGQKCSAASRVLVDQGIKDRFVERLEEAVKDIQVGPAFDGSTFVNPLIARQEKERLQKEVKEAIAEANKLGGRAIVDRSQEDLPGYCMGPVVIEMPAKAAKDPNTYACKELFGPVLHLIPVKDLDEAIEIMNCTEYALTAGIFGQSQDDIDYFQARIAAGNVYVNRPNTGARVGIEPFGGFKMSGTGPKAGSRSYVKAFHIFSPMTDIKEKNSSVIEQGPDFTFDMPTVAPDSLEHRVVQFEKVMNDMVGNYENIFRGTHELDKENLISFRDWVLGNLKTFSYGHHGNQYIPGQLSYDDFRMQKGRGVLIAHKKTPSIESLINFLSAMVLGSGIVIVARNREAYATWLTITRKLYRNGFSKSSLKLYFASDILLDKILQSKDIEFFIVDAELGDYEGILDMVFEKIKVISNSREFMTPLFTPFDGLTLGRWDDYLEQFINKRSMAVNTMRHGAPMDISL